MASFHKVIKLLIQICSEFALFPMEGSIERAHSVAKFHLVALSLLPLKAMQIRCRFELKSFITLWKRAIGRKILGTSYSLRTLYVHIQINRFGNLQLDTVPHEPLVLEWPWLRLGAWTVNKQWSIVRFENHP